MVKKEYYVVEDLDTKLYWHIQKTWWQQNPFTASLSDCTEEDFRKLEKKIKSKRFLEVQQRKLDDWSGWEWKPGHKLGIAKISFICEDGIDPEVEDPNKVFS